MILIASFKIQILIGNSFNLLLNDSSMKIGFSRLVEVREFDSGSKTYVELIISNRLLRRKTPIVNLQ